MKKRAFFVFIAALLSAGLLCTPPVLRSAAAKAPQAHACGPLPHSDTFAEPPDVVVSQLPLDADGRHELILVALRDGERFCYRYRWNGATQTVAPTIRVRAGETFAVRIVNEIAGPSAGADVASSAIPPCKPMPMPPAPVVHYVGYLNHVLDDRWMPKIPLDTNIHLHGFQGPASQEDVFLSTLSTPEHACEYAITVPRSQPPGTYFYHPHAHGASQIQVAGGLSGVWIVEPATPEIAPANDHVVVIRYSLPFANDNDFAPDETALGTDAAEYEGSRNPAPPVRYDPFKPPPWPLPFPMTVGTLVLDPRGCDGAGSDAAFGVNGDPGVTNLDVPGSTTQLLRLVNATSDSPKAFKLRDASGTVVPMRVAELDGNPVGGDATRPLSQFVATSRLMLVPSGRADLLVSVPAGQTLTLSTTHYCEGADAFYQMRREVLRIHGVATPASADPAVVASTPVDERTTPAARLLAYARAHPQAVSRRAITLTEYALPKRGKIPFHLSFFITDTTNTNFHEHVFYPQYSGGATVPENADIIVKRGAIEEWYLINTTMEAHVFHTHQMPFAIENDSLGRAPAMADTFFVPVGSLLRNRVNPNHPFVKPTITKVLLDFRHVPRGTFVFHCHMLFHEDRGMMAIIRVV